jgi:hypothetical protein
MKTPTHPSSDFLALRAVRRLGEGLLLSWLKANASRFSMDLRESPDGHPPIHLGAATQWGQWTPTTTSSVLVGRLALTAEGESAFQNAYGIEARTLALLGSSTHGFVQLEEEVRGDATVRRLRPLIYTVEGEQKRCLVFNLAEGVPLRPDQVKTWIQALQKWLLTVRLPARLGTGLPAKQRLWEVGLRDNVPRSLWSNS